MTIESSGPSVPENETEAVPAEQSKEEKWKYFADAVHAVRFATSELGEEHQRELLERRRHNAKVRARTAARVAGGLTLSGRMPSRRRK
jgi:hypothetical protein